MDWIVLQREEDWAMKNIWRFTTMTSALLVALGMLLAPGAQAFTDLENPPDLNQTLADKAWDQKFNMPIILVTQLLGLAFGYSPKELGLDRNRPKPNLEALGVLGKETASA